jgi:hypothetical protein
LTLPLSPCPYYQEGQACPYRPDCPIARYMPEKKCTELKQVGISIVQEWLKDKKKDVKK